MQIRELKLGLKPDKFQEIDGGLLIKDVPLLASGIWTDSAMGTPLYYPESTLKKYANNWLDHSVWARHAGKIPRSIVDKIGEIRNPHYEGGAVKGDVWLHGVTQTSRDVIELIKKGIVNSVSVEHSGVEGFNRSKNRYESESIEFHGLAIVNRGACTTCTINNESKLLSSIEGGINMIDTEIIPSLVVRRDKLGHIVLDTEKRLELEEKCEKGLSIEEIKDLGYPKTGHVTGIQVSRSLGIVYREPTRYG